MTYTLSNGTAMVLADVGDTFTVDPMLVFTRDGKEIPASAAIPSIRSIDIQESPIADGFNVELTHTNGRATTRFFYTMEAVASYIQFLALHSPSETAPATQVDDDTPPTATTAAQAAVDGAMGLLKEDVSDLLDEESPLCITFHTAQRVFMADGSPVTLEDVDKVAELLTASDRLASAAETAGRGKAKAAAEVAAVEARAAATNALKSLFTDDDLELADFHNGNFTAWRSMGPWLRLYQQLLLLRRSVDSGNIGTLTLTRTTGSDGSCLLHPDGKVFTVADIPGYTVYVFDSCDTTISAALSAGYRIRIDDRYVDDDELRYRLTLGMSYALGDYYGALLYELNDGADEWDPALSDDVITIAAHATPADLLALLFVYNFGHWLNVRDCDYEIEDVFRSMAGRLRGASVVPAGDAQDITEDVLDDTARRYISNHIRPRARRVVDMCDKCIRLRKENNHRDADSELTDIINTAKLLRLDAAGWIPMDEWGAINRRAAAATDGGGDPRYWGYIAAEYIKWAEQQLSTATA